MNESRPDPQHLADPMLLTLLRTLFEMADAETRRRAGCLDRSPTGPTGADGGIGDEDDVTASAAHLRAAVDSHLMDLPADELHVRHHDLARALLHEADRLLARGGSLPGPRIELGRFAVETSLPIRPESPQERPPCGSGPHRPPLVGLVSLPWMAPSMPSIQLATLGSALAKAAIAFDVHEFYVDYAARIGLNLYYLLDNMLAFLPEWVFSRHYYEPETGDDLSSMLVEQPLAELPWPDGLGETILASLKPVTERYLDDLMTDVDWSRYDVVGCSLTISQLGASMAFARRLKLAHPSVVVVFGGSQCAGPMGQAILRICPYVDVVVHAEGEPVLPELVRRLRAGLSPVGIAGISHRIDGLPVTNGPSGPLVRLDGPRPSLDYDPYFTRLTRLGLTEKVNPWLPFETSRGCWYGEKVQCTFCGLHEIMKFRAWAADPVLTELERLAARYGVGRFYCMDLIMPRDYLRTLLPEVVSRGHDWKFFYEIKANVRRSELELLAEAGVHWVQPGIESLDSDLLALMRKGVRPAQNIALLKWSRELGIYCGWNLLFGLPGETQAPYDRMGELIPKLVHLQPPAGGGRFQLHRFSPYFDQPEAFGIEWKGAHPMFRHAFPVAEPDLNDLVYLHDFGLDPAMGEPVDSSKIDTAVRAWQRAYRDGATLVLSGPGNDDPCVVDRRDVTAPALVHRLTVAEARLLRFLDAGVPESKLAERFASEEPSVAAELGGAAAIEGVVRGWLFHDLVVRLDGRLLALPMQAERIRVGSSLAERAIETLPYADTVQHT
jgi:ribosomal peptide maturation radical SAM protein 1